MVGGGGGASLAVECRFIWYILVDCIWSWTKSKIFLECNFGLWAKIVNVRQIVPVLWNWGWIVDCIICLNLLKNLNLGFCDLSQAGLFELYIYFMLIVLVLPGAPSFYKEHLQSLLKSQNFIQEKILNFVQDQMQSPRMYQMNLHSSARLAPPPIIKSRSFT